MDARRNRTARSTVALGAAALLVAGWGPSAAAAGQVRAAGSFDGDGPAYTYAASVVPSGASARVHTVETGSGKTVATLHVRGFAPNTTYAVHAHTGSCGSDPLQSAGHYMRDPSGGVSADNELWLGFTTNAAGNGRAQAVVEWQFRPGGAQSITFHHGGPARVACLPVGF